MRAGADLGYLARIGNFVDLKILGGYLHLEIARVYFKP
jgi:hypothetical protein